MLVLSRHKSEQIVIGDDLARIILVDIRGDKVRIGVEAPKSMSVHRLEVFDAIKQEAGDSPLVPSAYVMSPRDLVVQFASHELLMQAMTSGFVQFSRPSDADIHLAKGA